MNALSQAQIVALNLWISNQYENTTQLYQRLAEISVAYARMYLTLSESGCTEEVRSIGNKEDLYVLSELMAVLSKN